MTGAVAARRVQGLLEEQEAEAPAQPVDAQRDSSACTDEAVHEDKVTEMPFEKAPDPPRAAAGETHAQFWHRHFAHVRNKGRHQIQVRAQRPTALKRVLFMAPADQCSTYVCSTCCGSGCKAVARPGRKFRCQLDFTIRLRRSWNTH